MTTLTSVKEDILVLEMVVLLDHSKAFESVNHDIHYRTLRTAIFNETIKKGSLNEAS